MMSWQRQKISNEETAVWDYNSMHHPVGRRTGIGTLGYILVARSQPDPGYSDWFHESSLMGCPDLSLPDRCWVWFMAGEDVGCIFVRPAIFCLDLASCPYCLEPPKA